MSTPSASSHAFWWSADIGTTAPQRLAPGTARRWTRDDFDDRAVSTLGVSFQLLDQGWAVSNHSSSMTNLYVLDARFGRRQVAPRGALTVLSRTSWLLIPSLRGVMRPHVVTLALAGTPSPIRGGLAARDPDDATASAGEPVGAALHEGLRRAAGALRDADVRALLAVYARPYFSVGNHPLAPARRREVADCIPGSKHRGDLALLQLRKALWGRAEGQSADVVIRILIRHGLLTARDVRDVRHAGCRHRPVDLDPTMPR